MNGALAEKLGRGLQNLVGGSVTRRCLQSSLKNNKFDNSGEWWNGLHRGLKILAAKTVVGSNPTSPTKYEASISWFFC